MAARTNDAYGTSNDHPSGGGGGRRRGSGGGSRQTERGPLGPLLSGVNVGLASAQGFCRDVRSAIDDEGK